MATLKESAESRGTMIFTQKSSGSFIASCSFSQTLQRQRLSSSSRSDGKRVSLQSSDSILSQIGLLIEEDLFSMSAASPHDPFRSLANNRISVVQEYASTFTPHLDSLLSNSIISNSIHRVAVLLNDIAIFEIFKEGPGKIYIKTAGEGKAAIRLQKKIFASRSSFKFIVITNENNQLFHRGKFGKKPISKNIAVLFYKSHSSAPATLDRERCRFSCRYRMLKKISIEIF